MLNNMNNQNQNIVFDPLNQLLNVLQFHSLLFLNNFVLFDIIPCLILPVGHDEFFFNDYEHLMHLNKNH